MSLMQNVGREMIIENQKMVMDFFSKSEVTLKYKDSGASCHTSGILYKE